jgi:hypothetical protein
MNTIDQRSNGKAHELPHILMLKNVIQCHTSTQLTAGAIQFVDVI